VSRRQEISVQLSRADQARDPYFYVPFQVPPGMTRIDVAVAYRKAADCIVDVGLFDPGLTAFPSAAGFRG
jgi:hypothetical protein